MPSEVLYYKLFPAVTRESGSIIRRKVNFDKIRIQLEISIRKIERKKI